MSSSAVSESESIVLKSTSIPLEYLTFLQFGENCICAIAQCFSLLLFVALLLLSSPNEIFGSIFCCSFSSIPNGTKFSPALKLLFCVQIIGSLISLPYHFYRVWNWHLPDTYTVNPYSPEILFWTGMLAYVYYGIAPAAVFMLTLERCLMLRFPMANFFKKRQFQLAQIALILAVAIYNAIGFMTELPFDPEKFANCEWTSCMFYKNHGLYQAAGKITFSTTNVLTSVIFLYQVYGTELAKKLNNRIVVFTICVETFWGIIPGYPTFLFNYISGIPNSRYTGEIGIFLCSLDGVACALAYWLLLRWRQKQQEKKKTIIKLNNTNTAILGGRVPSEAEMNNKLRY